MEAFLTCQDYVVSIMFHHSGDTCEDPGTPPGGSQIATTYEEGAMVYFKCDKPGYTVSDSYPFLCETSGSSVDWNSTVVPDCVGECPRIRFLKKKQKSTYTNASHTKPDRSIFALTDTEPPVFAGCGSAQLVIDKLTSPEYLIPKPSDNSGSETSLTVTVDPDNFDPTHQMVDSLNVTYTATDLSGNAAECVVSIRVRGMNNNLFQLRFHLYGKPLKTTLIIIISVHF